jgi:hypothetical protein
LKTPILKPTERFFCARAVGEESFLNQDNRKGLSLLINDSIVEFHDVLLLREPVRREGVYPNFYDCTTYDVMSLVRDVALLMQTNINSSDYNAELSH